jgi:hypothetical protein
VQDALPIVIVVVVVLAAIVAVVLALSGDRYDHIGRGGMTFDRDAPSPAPANDPFRDEEIRQMLAARGARRGEEVDVEAELAALTAPPPADDALRAEVRAFVEARNERRIARGQAPLDVEAEVERRLSGQDE